jgi:hypothetical protein
VAPNTLVNAVRRELHYCEHATVICAQHLELAVTFLLYDCLVALDGDCNCRLGIEQHGPHVAGGIADE